MTKLAHVPNEGSKAYHLLSLLLGGTVVDPQVAFLELNLPTVQARVAELRRLGWPIRALSLPHPKLQKQKMVAYTLDAHFRAWMTEHPGTHPGEYPFSDGRGKFAGADFKAGVKPTTKGSEALTRALATLMKDKA